MYSTNLIEVMWSKFSNNIQVLSKLVVIIMDQNNIDIKHSGDVGVNK